MDATKPSSTRDVQLSNMCMQLSIYDICETTIYYLQTQLTIPSCYTPLNKVSHRWCFNCNHTPTELYLVQIIGVATP
jgi:hypothetical protein